MHLMVQNSLQDSRNSTSSRSLLLFASNFPRFRRKVSAPIHPSAARMARRAPVPRVSAGQSGMGRARARALRLDFLREGAAVSSPRPALAAGAAVSSPRPALEAGVAALEVGSSPRPALEAGVAALEVGSSPRPALEAGVAALEAGVSALEVGVAVLEAGVAAYVPCPGGLRAACSPPLQGGYAAHQVRSPV